MQMVQMINLGLRFLLELCLLAAGRPILGAALLGIFIANRLLLMASGW